MGEKLSGMFSTSLLLVCLVLLSSCKFSETNVNQLWNEPAPLPDFIRFLPREVWPNRMSCTQGVIVLNGDVIWENGNQAEDVARAIVRTLEFSIDGRPVNEPHLIFYEPVGRIAPGEVGTFLPEIPICIDLNSLGFGLHHARIRFASVSGVEYEHEWAFNLIPTPPIATVDAP